MATIRKLIRFCAFSILLFGTITQGYGKISIKGFRSGRSELLQYIEILMPKNDDSNEAPSYNLNFIEDALWILRGKIQEQGYLNPQFSITAKTPDGQTLQAYWKDDAFEPTLPRNFIATSITFNIEPGVNYYFNSITLNGLPEELQDKEPESFFYTTSFIFLSEGDKFYTPNRLNAGKRRIIDALEQLGYSEATIEDVKTNIDDTSGQVNVNIIVNPKKKFYVRNLIINQENSTETAPVNNQLFTQTWLWQQVAKLRNQYYIQGYPDTQVEAKIIQAKELDDKVEVDIELELKPGSEIFINEVKFIDTDPTQKHVLNQSKTLHPGNKLNIKEAQAVCNRLSRLGIFHSVTLSYEKISNTQRSVIFTCKPKKRTIISLLAGFGSYEYFRGGVILEKNNIWGLAHKGRIKAVQSLKATYVNGTYTLPEFFHEDVSAYGKAFYLLRKEISFTTQELGASFGVQRFFKKNKVLLAAQYNFEDLQAIDPNIQSAEGRKRAQVSSITLLAQQNKRDDILFPTKGYFLFGSFEIAQKIMGGNVDYQKLELGATYHHPIFHGLIFHTGLKHGVITTFGAVANNIPFNKRFFPGGETTIRGYRQGQASPKNINGKAIGTEAYTLLNLELEQQISQKFSTFIFLDNLFFAKNIKNYPMNKALFSAGLGISYKTVVGPFRVSYARNLNCRSDDPIGTFHFSLGFPF